MFYKQFITVSKMGLKAQVGISQVVDCSPAEDSKSYQANVSVPNSIFVVKTVLEITKADSHLERLLVLQLSGTPQDLLSLDYYLRKTFFKTASLMANSCKAIALLSGQTQEVCQQAWDYGRHLGLAFQVRLYQY